MKVELDPCSSSATSIVELITPEEFVRTVLKDCEREDEWDVVSGKILAALLALTDSNDMMFGKDKAGNLVVKLAGEKQ